MPEPQQTPAEYHDEYSETLGTEFRKLEDALLSDTVSLLASADPIRLDETTAVEVALEAMLAQVRLHFQGKLGPTGIVKVPHTQYHKPTAPPPERSGRT